MRRTFVLGTVLAVAALSLTITGTQREPSEQNTLRMRAVTAQDGTPPFGGALLYLITGGDGTTLALVDEGTGVVLVDTMRAGWGKPLLDALRSVTEMPVTTIINTHTHLDHTGSNKDFPMAIEVIAHANTKTHMVQMDAFRGANERFLPNKTFTQTLSLLHGSNRIDLYYFGPAHTDGDAIVVFPEKRLAYVGDLFPSKAAPLIDTSNGGSGVAFPDTLAKALELKGIDRVITGHGHVRGDSGVQSATAGRPYEPEILRWADLQEYAEFNREFLSAVREAFKTGKSVDAAVANFNLPEQFKQYGMERARANVQTIYEELQRP
jgi:glyoxylase-like metal-dependent hydrolase (beta-lactamase superfamily II)